MNGAITLGGLLLALGALGGALIAAAGLLTTFAGGMSDAPDVGRKFTRQGCFFTVLGVALCGASIWGLLS